MWLCLTTHMATTLIHTWTIIMAPFMVTLIQHWFLGWFPPNHHHSYQSEFKLKLNYVQSLAMVSLLTQNKTPNTNQNLKGPTWPSLWSASWTLIHPRLHAGRLAVLQEPSKLLSHVLLPPQILSSLIPSPPSGLCWNTIHQRGFSWSPSMNSVHHFSLWFHSPCSICLHTTTSRRVSHNTPDRRMQALWGDISFGVFSVLVTAVSQHLEHNRLSGNICWKYK